MSLITTSVSSFKRKDCPPETPSIPFILQHAISDIETKLSTEWQKSKDGLTVLRARLCKELDGLCEDNPGHIRPIRDVRRKIELVDTGLGKLTNENVMQRLQSEKADFISRFKELEKAEKERKRANEDRVKTSETRFLPVAPVNTTSSTAKRSRNYASLIAQEIKYSFGIEQRPVDLILFDMCPKCMVAMQYDVNSQKLVCPIPSCRYWKRFADMTSAALAYGEEVEFYKYSYNPSTHLDDTIKYAEAGEAYVVPPEHLEEVMRQLYMKRISPEEITIPMIRDITYENKKIKTENTVQIYSRLTGRAPRRLSTFAKDQVRIMFITEEPYYRKHCMSRINLLSYPYKLYKYCELLGYWEMLETLPLLRGQSNLYIHDIIQARINRELDWEFIPTIQDV